MRVLFVFLLMCASAFAADTGFVNATTTRQIATDGNSTTSTPEFGKTSSRTVQALFGWSLSIPDYAEITKVEIQFQWDRPSGTCKLYQINKTWNSSSTWSSLGSGLSGSELGSLLHTQGGTSCCGTISVTSEEPSLIDIIQKDNDGQDTFDGIVALSDVTNTLITNDMNIARIKVTYTERIAGDADNDGDVDFTDFLAVSRNYNECGHEWEDGDFNGDGCVDFADYLILSGNYGYPGSGEPPDEPE